MKSLLLALIILLIAQRTSTADVILNNSVWSNTIFLVQVISMYLVHDDSGNLLLDDSAHSITGGS